MKPCLEYSFAIKVGGKGVEFTQELETPLGPATREEVAESEYSPEEPSGFAPEVGGQLAMLRWDRADCADRHEVYIISRADDGGGGEATYRYLPVKDGETSVQANDLDFCTPYEVEVTAFVAGRRGGTFTGSFSTRPRPDAARDMALEIAPSLDSVEMTLEVWSVSCVDQYDISVCDEARGECKPTATVKKTGRCEGSA